MEHIPNAGGECEQAQCSGDEHEKRVVNARQCGAKCVVDGNDLQQTQPCADIDERKANADATARRRVDGSIHADDLTLQVEVRPTGVAAIDRRVDLQEVVVGSGADIAAACRHDTRCHRAAETIWIADGDDVLTDAWRALGELNIGIVCGGLDLDQREIGLGIRADDLGIE